MIRLILQGLAVCDAVGSKAAFYDLISAAFAALARHLNPAGIGAGAKALAWVLALGDSGELAGVYCVLRKCPAPVCYSCETVRPKVCETLRL